MGRATILGGGTAGLYTVGIDYGSDRLDALIQAETERLAVKNAELFEARTELESAEAAVPALIAAVEVAMEAFRAAWEENCTPEGWQKDPLRDEIDRLISLTEDRAYLTDAIAELEANIPLFEEERDAASLPRARGFTPRVDPYISSLTVSPPCAGVHPARWMTTLPS
jgi:hypothetical protein